MRSLAFIKTSIIAVSAIILLGISGCKKSSTEQENDYGCDSQTVLQTVTNMPAVLLYVPAQSEWVVFLDLPGSISIGCSFCDKSAITAIVAGQPETAIFNVYVSGSIKKRLANQIPLSVTTGYKEVYLISNSTVSL